MSQRFLRCLHCGLPHAIDDAVCPITGRPLDARRVAARPAQADAQKIAVSSKPSSSAGKPMQVASSISGVGSNNASSLGSNIGANAAKPMPVASSLSSAGKQPVGNVAPRVVASPMVAASMNASPGVPAPFESAPSDVHRIGTVLGAKYRTVRVLGEGGMGTVYECEHLQLHRRVAVKLLHPSQARKKASVQRFHHEAQVAGAIGHPNICEVYDMGETEDGAPFLVMELLQGETLADRIASEGALPFDDIIDVIVQVLSGLVAAHDKGIIHRDIKPENVFLQQRTGLPAMVKLLDFGISKVAGADDLHLTRTGMVMGTPFYMSPEQARGDRSLDMRVDIYASGVMMYECLTGRRPFHAPNYNALLVQILTTGARPPSEIRPAIPAGFETVVAKAMHRDREKRYASAAEMQREVTLLRDPAAMRRMPSAPPDPVPLVTPRRDRSPGNEPTPPPRYSPALPNEPKPPPREELPAISLDIEGHDLLDSAARPAHGSDYGDALAGDSSAPDSSSEVPIAPVPQAARAMLRQSVGRQPVAPPVPHAPSPRVAPRPPDQAQPPSMPPPRPSQGQVQPANDARQAAPPSSQQRIPARPAPRPSAPSQATPPRPNPLSVPPPMHAVMPPPIPAVVPPRGGGRSLTPTPTPVEASRFFVPPPAGPMLDAPYLDEGDDADPTEVGSLPVEAHRSRAPRPRPVDADATERIQPPWLTDGISSSGMPRPASSPGFDPSDVLTSASDEHFRGISSELSPIGSSSDLSRPQVDVSAEPPSDEGDDNPTTLFERKPRRRTGRSSPGEPRPSITERAAAPTSTFGRRPSTIPGDKTPVDQPRPPRQPGRPTR